MNKIKQLHKQKIMLKELVESQNIKQYLIKHEHLPTNKQFIRDNCAQLRCSQKRREGHAARLNCNVLVNTDPISCRTTWTLKWKRSKICKFICLQNAVKDLCCKLHLLYFHAYLLTLAFLEFRLFCTINNTPSYVFVQKCCNKP